MVEIPRTPPSPELCSNCGLMSKRNDCLFVKPLGLEWLIVYLYIMVPSSMVGG